MKHLKLPLAAALCLLAASCMEPYVPGSVRIDAAPWYPSDPIATEGTMPDAASLRPAPEVWTLKRSTAGNPSVQSSGGTTAVDAAIDATSHPSPSAQPATMTVDYDVEDVISGKSENTEVQNLSLIVSLLSYARIGHAVTVGPSGEVDDAGSDTLSLTTTSVDEVITWTSRMVKAGYKVTITYNRDTGIYRCVARKVKKKEN